MASYANFESKANKHTRDRYDVFEPAFESPVKPSDISAGIVSKHIEEFNEFCAILKWYPDMFWDLYKPEVGGLTFDLHQRVMLRSLARFFEVYLCAPRGISKTLLHIMHQYHTACCYPGIKLTVTAATKESAVKIWQDKHNEIEKFYPGFMENIKSARFQKDTAVVEFQNGSVIDNLANSQSSKGRRRHRGGLEESNLIDNLTYYDAIEPIFNIPRTTITGIVDPQELNGQIHRYSTSGYKNSDEYMKILSMKEKMVDLKGSFVFTCDWMIPVHYGRMKKSTIDNARRNNVTMFRQNYLCDWIGVLRGGIVNISKLMKGMILDGPELECPKDKRGNYMLNEYVLAVDVARSASDANSKTAISVLKIVRNQGGSVSQIHVSNVLTPPNGLNFEEQSIYVKKVFYRYGGDIDPTKSRVKAIVVDGNTIGQGLVEKLLEDISDPETGEELGCFSTINTNDIAKVKDAPAFVYVLKQQGINSDIIRIFQDYVDSNKIKFTKRYSDVDIAGLAAEQVVEVETACLQIQGFIDEVSNLRLKMIQNNTALAVEQVVSTVDKDRYTSMAYGIYYIDVFMNVVEDDDEYDFVFSYS